MNTKTEKPNFSGIKIEKTDLKNSQNRKTENPNVPLLHLRIFVLWENNYLGQFSVTQFRAQIFPHDFSWDFYFDNEV